MHRLHGRNHAHGGKAGNVVVAENLGVLHTKAMIGRGIRAERGIVGVEHDAVAAIADGVGVHLEAGAQRPRGDVLNVRGSAEEQAPIIGVIAVRFEKCRSARAKCPVGVQLERADPESIVVQSALRPAREVMGDRGRIVAHHDVEAERNLARLRHLLQQVDRRARLARVVQADEPPLVRLGDGGGNGAPVVLARRGGNGSLDKRLRVVDEDAGGFARSGALDLAATRIHGRGGDAGRAHRGSVAISGVTVHPCEPDRIIRQCARERVVGGEARIAPVVLVPAAPENPRAGRLALGTLDDARDHLVQ